MRRWGRRIAYGLVGLGVVLAGLYVALPPAKTEAEGAADPILWIRKPVVKGLHHLGIVPRSFLGPDDWIPSSAGSETWAGEGKTFETADAATRVTWEYQPVYRGVFWRAGMRAGYKVDRRGDPKDDPHHLRLWWKGADGREVRIADGGPMTPDSASGLRRWRVDGYVPPEARSAGIDWVMPDGTTCCGESWSRD
jgi:hypothetical protein